MASRDYILRVLDETMHESIGNCPKERKWFEKSRRNRPFGAEYSYQRWAMEELLFELRKTDKPLLDGIRRFADRMIDYANKAYQKDIFETAVEVALWAEQILNDICEAMS